MMWILLAAGAANATEIGTRRAFGLGVQVGSPTGITGKVYLGGRKNAIDFLFGDAYYGDNYFDGLYAHVNYHWNVAELTRGRGVTIPFRVGVGGFVANDYFYDFDNRDDDVVVGARVPFGLDFDLDRAPVQFWIEVAIDVTVLPPLGVGADGGIGVRYYF